MPELWGVDDPQELKRIERAVKARTHSYFRGIFFLGGTGLVSAAIGRLLTPYFPTAATTATLIVFFLGLLIYFAGEFSRDLRAKAEVLRSMGRCLNCGYKLEPSTKGPCPECGRSIGPLAE